MYFTTVATDADDKPILEGLTTVTFVEHKGRTMLTLRASAVAVVDCAATHLNGMEVGWKQSIDRLAAEAAAG
ncbi:MAG TPA: SRPBCC domain-containing protein [Roseiarcus sp.]|nr:SRPBCC domain-containing protein [Roseiarcus sp.]